MTERETKAIEELKNNSTDLCEELIEEGSILEEFAIVAWEQKILWPATLYEKAPQKIRDDMIAILEQDDVSETLNTNHLLMDLAMMLLQVHFRVGRRIQKYGEKNYMLVLVHMQWKVAGVWKMVNEESYGLIHLMH